MFKNVDTTVPGTLWGTNTESKYAYQVQAEQNMAGATENAALERAYHPETIQQAKDALISQGIQPTPKNIYSAMQKAGIIKPTAADNQAAYQAQFASQFKRGQK